MSVVADPNQIIISNEKIVTASSPMTTSTTGPIQPLIFNLKLPSFWTSIHTLKIIRVSLNASSGTLPLLSHTGHVTAVIIQNPPSNSSPITVQGEEVPVGSSWIWRSIGANFDLDPTCIYYDTGGQPIIVAYEYYSD